MYYTIKDNNILTAENEVSLNRYYKEVYILPEDYEEGKYIVVDGELVLNPNYEEEQAQKERERRNQEIDEKIKELQIMALPEVLNGNIENIKIYNSVIDGLEKAKL